MVDVKRPENVQLANFTLEKAAKKKKKRLWFSADDGRLVVLYSEIARSSSPLTSLLCKKGRLSLVCPVCGGSLNVTFCLALSNHRPRAHTEGFTPAALTYLRHFNRHDAPACAGLAAVASHHPTCSRRRQTGTTQAGIRRRKTSPKKRAINIYTD